MDFLYSIRARFRLVEQSARMTGFSLARRMVWPAWLALVLAPVPGSSMSPGIAVATFDEVWQQVRDSHYEYERVREDWERLREPLRAEAEAAEDLDDLRGVLTELLAVLGDSHYTVLPAELMDAALEPEREAPVEGAQGHQPGRTGIRIALVDDRVLVTRVDPGSPGERAGLDEGMTLVSINDQAVAERLEAVAELEQDRDRRWSRTFLQTAIQERVGSPDRARTLELVVLDVDGRERTIEIEPVAAEAQTFRTGSLPPMRFLFDSERVDRAGGHCIGRVEFTTWVPALTAALERELPPLLDCKGLVFDLRGNIGGVMGMMMPAAGWFFDEVATLGTMRNPSGEIHFRALPKRVLFDGTAIKPFTGPVAILIDSASVSTSEMFTAGLQQNGRARVFGTRTPGMALPANARELSSGDSLMYVMADYTGPTGERIEGGGVEPDQVVIPTPESLAACDDPVLVAAFDWIEQRSGHSSCSTTKDHDDE